MSARLVPTAIGFFFLMSFEVPSIATFRSAGIVDGFLRLRIGARLPSWLVVLPAVPIVALASRRLATSLVRAA